MNFEASAVAFPISDLLLIFSLTFNSINKTSTKKQFNKTIPFSVCFLLLLLLLLLLLFVVLK